MTGAVPQRLVVFTRYPEPGRVKTRLIPVLGASGTAELQRAMTRHTLAAAADLRRRAVDLDVVVRFTGSTQPLMERQYGAEWSFQEQGEGELGARLERAIRDAFEEGREQVAVIGSDCPELNSELLHHAFHTLNSADVVLGPAADGGYYLIGLRETRPSLFANIPWGTGEVLDRTVREARRIGLEVRLLPMLRDVDRAEDLPVWERARSGAVVS